MEERDKKEKPEIVMSGEEVAKAFVTHFYSKFANNGAQVNSSGWSVSACKIEENEEQKKTGVFHFFS